MRPSTVSACMPWHKSVLFDFTNIVISVSIKSDLRNFLVSFDHASFGFVYKLAQVSMFNNKCSLLYRQMIPNIDACLIRMKENRN